MARASGNTPPTRLVEELHRRQGEMYAGGPVEPVLELLAPEVVWHVPGSSPIAGDHRGHAEVLAYFEKRRRLANATMRMHPGVSVCEGDAVRHDEWPPRLLADPRGVPDCRGRRGWNGRPHCRGVARATRQRALRSDLVVASRLTPIGGDEHSAPPAGCAHALGRGSPSGSLEHLAQFAGFEQRPPWLPNRR